MVIRIFFPIIATLILLCVGSCAYANYFKSSINIAEDEDGNLQNEDIYTLNKPDRPYLTPFYQRRTFQSAPPAYDNHAFRPGGAAPAPNGMTVPTTGAKLVTQPTNIYQGHQPRIMQQQQPNPYGQVNPYAVQPNQYGQNPYQQQQAPLRSYSFHVPQQNSYEAPGAYRNNGQAFDRSKSFAEYSQHNKEHSSFNNGRSSPVQSTKSAPATFPRNNLRRTFSSPNLSPGGSRDFNAFDQHNSQDTGGFNLTHRHSVNYGSRYNQRGASSPASSSSSYIPAASEVGSTAPLFGRRRSPGGHSNVYESHNPVSSRSASHYGGTTQSQYGGSNQDYYQQQPRRSYEMEDIYGQRGNGMARYAQNNPAFNANQFGNYNQQQPQEAFDPYNQQNPQQNFYQQQQSAQAYEDMSAPPQYNQLQQPQQHHQQGEENYAYDPYNDPYNSRGHHLPGQ